MIDATDDEIGRRVRALAIAETTPRDPALIAERITAAGSGTRQGSWLPMRRLALAGSLGFLLAASVGIVLIATSGSQLLDATVKGTSYGVAVARSFAIDPTRLSEYGEAQVASALAFDSTMTYQIEEVDPTTVLVMRLLPGQRDDAGDLGEYVLLVRGPDAFAAVCQYFDPTSEATPRACRPG